MRGQPQFVVCHAPPRMAKTESVLHFIPWVLDKRPDWTIGYVTYADRLARAKSRKAQILAETAGIQLATRAKHEWRTTDGGGVLATSIRGTLIGHGLNIAIVDDPVKNRIDAESSTIQQANNEWFDDVLFSRIEPGGSCFVFMHRWTPKDLAGRLVSEGWDYIKLPAINEKGESLWPERWPIAELEKKKKRSTYTWSSIYQGDPKPRGATVFGEPHTYSELPTVYQAGFGVDLSYTAKTSSDWSVVVKMVKAGDKKYVVDVIRKQVRAPKFKKICRRLHRADQSAPWRFYGYGPEVGSADFMNEGPREVPLEIISAPGDKFIRSRAYAEEWNAGNILLPKSARWLDDFVAEHSSFTGVNDPEDDQVDAAAACNDVLDGGGWDEIEEKPKPPKLRGLAGEAM